MRWIGSLAAVVLTAAVGASGSSIRFQVVTPKDDGIVATGINEGGTIVGFVWTEEKSRPSVLVQAPFLARGKEVTYLPLLDGYTATFPAAVSDDERVVGRASKPGRPGVRIPLRNQAFVWDAPTGIRGLGALRGDWASVACGITRDGRRISGFSVGDGRVRACVWDRGGDVWTAAALPQMARLGAHVVAISGKGRHVASVDGSAACLWSSGDSGAWRREVIAEAGALLPRAVNDQGSVAGVAVTGDGLTHAAIWTRADGYRRLEKPAGYVRAEAHALNNVGVVVGMVDGPGGSDIGPNAFVYERGQLRLIGEGGPNFASADAINDSRQIAGVLERREGDGRASGAGR